MKAQQPDLNNFSMFKATDLLSGSGFRSQSGIVHTKRTTCPTCGGVCRYNGSSNKGGNIFSRSTGAFFRKGQQYCPHCNKTIQVDNPWLDKTLESMNQYITSQVVSLSEYLSEDEIVSHFSSTMGINLSKSCVHNIITKSNESFETMEFDYTVHQGFYSYDEQYVKIHGRRAFRIVIYDLKDDGVIYEKIHYRFSKVILEGILREVFPTTKPNGFVTDMRLEYPSAFRRVFGEKVKVQFCIFHLNKLILKEYSDALKTGKYVNWTLMDMYNLYSLFNIFYNRTFELKYIKGLMDSFENFKTKLTEQKVSEYVKRYNIKYKAYERQEAEVIRRMEKKLVKVARKVLSDKRNLRKRRKQTLEARTVDSARKKFTAIQQQKAIYPKKIQQRIEKIETNFVYFTASDGQILTNNRLEGHFGATLKKFRKKSRKSLQAFSALLKKKRAKRESREAYRKFTISDMAMIFTVLTLFAS